MSFFKRIFLFMLTNILIVVTISIILNLLGVSSYVYTRTGVDYYQLMMFCLVWGFGGAFISLALSRIMAKMMMGVKLIDPRTGNSNEQWLLSTVQQLSRAANLPVMPEVGIYEGEEVNAFATGPTKSRALVAVSSGLLRNMNKDQVEGVLAHEIAHVANGDMVTMTLLQGVVNAFVMFISRAVAFAISQAMRSKDDDRPAVPSFLIVMVLEIFLGMLGMMVVAYFSRLREFRADQGGATFAGKDKMVNALMGLRRTIEGIDNSHEAMNTMKISGKPSRFLGLFSTHPPLEVRIERLQNMRA